MTSIFVAKLDFGVDNPQLKAIFDPYGKVLKATVAIDRETGKSRGFGFVEMANDDEAQNAIQALDNSTVNGRQISVKQAEDRGGVNKKPPFNPSNNRGDFKPRENRGDFTPREGGARSNASDMDSDLGNDRPIVPFIQDDFATRELARKKEKEVAKKKEKPKTHKMEAYKKSGKDNAFLNSEDDLDEEFDLFGRDEDEELDDDYSKYLVNSDEDEEYEDDDFEDDEDYEDDED